MTYSWIRQISRLFPPFLYPPISSHSGTMFGALFEWIFFPFYFTKHHQIAELSIENYSFMLIYILLILVFLRLIISKLFQVQRFKELEKNHISPRERLFLIFFLSSFFIWEMTFSYYRYLAPLEGLAPILIFILLRYLLVKRAAIVTLFFILFNAINPHYPDWGRISWGKSYFQLEGIKKELPKEARVLVSGKPLAFVIPELPTGFEFFGLGNLDGIASSYWYKEMHERIQKSTKSLYLLTYKDSLSENQKTLRKVEVKIDINSCISLKNRARKGILLCKLGKIPGVKRRASDSFPDKQ